MEKAVQNKSELINLLQQHSSRIRQFGVQRLGIFGSFVKDNVKETSDVDFFIEFFPQQKSFNNFMELGFYLGELTGRKIELVTPQSLNKFIGKYILQEVEYVSIAA